MIYHGDPVVVLSPLQQLAVPPGAEPGERGGETEVRLPPVPACGQENSARAHQEQGEGQRVPTAAPSRLSVGYLSVFQGKKPILMFLSIFFVEWKL